MHKLSGNLNPINDSILVENIEEGNTVTKGGVILLDDDGKQHGIKARWAQVAKMGPKQNTFKVGQWVLIKHGRWSRSVKVNDQVLRLVENESIILTTDVDPRNQLATL